MGENGYLRDSHNSYILAFEVREVALHLTIDL